MKRNWKRVRATSLLQGLQLCVEHAKETRNRSVERIADLMAEETHHALYKWLGTGRMPLIKLAAFEEACGAHFVTQYLAASAHKLLVDIPSGRMATAEDASALQIALNDAASAILRFHAGKLSKDEALAALAAGMEGLAWHHHNVAKFEQPELELEP